MSPSPLPSPCVCQRLAGPEAPLHPRCVGHLWLLEGLTPEERSTLAPDLGRQTLAPGDVLFRQGDPGDRMFLLKMGSVKLSKVTEDGNG